MKISKMFNVGYALVGATLLLPIVANGQAAANSTASTAAVREGNIVVTMPVSTAWATQFPAAAANLTTTNADGLNNQQKMLAGLVPDNQSLNISATIAIPAVSVTTPTYEQSKENLQNLAATYHATAAQRRQELLNRATTAGIPVYISRGSNAPIATLIDFTDDGQPVYVTPFDIYNASTIGADQLWPTNSVTAVPGWISGRTGLNLNETNQAVGMWEAPYDTAGDSSVQTNHYQFIDSSGSSRTTQEDSDINPTGTSPHAMAVAGVLASGGKNDFFNLSSYFGASATNVNLGNYTHGIGFAGSVHAYALTTDLPGTFSDEAAGGLRLANNSWGQQCGWAFDGSDWIWFGGSNTNLEDWQFGAYVGIYSGGLSGTAPRELDQDAVSAPNTLWIFSSGNFLDYGPGHSVTYYLSTDPTKSNPQTAAKNWVDGDAGGYDTLPPSACAKDELTVGAVYALTPGYTNATSVTLAPFSSCGPTDDGRIKPDVVAAGIISTNITTYNPYGLGGFVAPYGDANDPNITNNYAWGWTGTSFSSPSVASGLGLVLQERDQIQPEWATNAWPIRSSTLRALAIETADQAGTNAGPSYQFGYGVFDAINAVNLMAADADTGAGTGAKPYVKESWLPSSVSEIQFNVQATNSLVPLKVTLAWTDPAGSSATSGKEDDPTVRLVNDLDLRIYPPGTTNFDPNASTTYKPWILNPDLTNQTVTARSAAATTGDDTRNNVEQVVVNSPQVGTNYIVRVTAKNNLGINGQWASIVISGNAVPTVNFRITNISNQGNGYYLIMWNAVVGGIYRIQGSPNLLGPYTDATGDISANLESMSYTVEAPNNNPDYFWRIARYY